MLTMNQNFFFPALEKFLYPHPEIPELHRKILILYCSGLSLNKIGEKVHRTWWVINDIIKIYEKKVRQS